MCPVVRLQLMKHSNQATRPKELVTAVAAGPTCSLLGQQGFQVAVGVCLSLGTGLGQGLSTGRLPHALSQLLPQPFPHCCHCLGPRILLHHQQPNRS